MFLHCSTFHLWSQLHSRALCANQLNIDSMSWGANLSKLAKLLPEQDSLFSHSRVCSLSNRDWFRQCHCQICTQFKLLLYRVLNFVLGFPYHPGTSVFALRHEKTLPQAIWNCLWTVGKIMEENSWESQENVCHYGHTFAQSGYLSYH